MDLEKKSPKDLLKLEQQILAELRNRGILRGNNKPAGDVGELLVQKPRGGKLEANSKKSYDVLDKNGNRIQVKVRVMEKDVQKFSVFRTFEFDFAIFIVFDPADHEVRWARELTSKEVVEASREYKHVGGRELTGSKVLKTGRDITDEIKRAFTQI